MKIFFAHFLFFVFILLLEISFLDILFPSLLAPIVILLTLFIWAFLLPSSYVFWKTIPLAVLFDIVVSSGGTVTLYSIPFVYCIGFLLRRFATNHPKGLLLFSFFFSFFGVLGFPFFASVFSYGPAILSENNGRQIFHLLLSPQSVLLTFFLCIPLFILLSYLVHRFEQWIQSVSDTASRKIR